MRATSRCCGDSGEHDGPGYAQRASDRALHFHGGYGFMEEYDIQLFYRRAKGWALVLADPRTASATRPGPGSGAGGGRPGLRERIRSSRFGTLAVLLVTAALVAGGVWFVTGNHDYYSGADAWAASVR